MKLKTKNICSGTDIFFGKKRRVPQKHSFVELKSTVLRRFFRFRSTFMHKPLEISLFLNTYS